MSGLLDILEKVKARPGMYFGKASVSDLFVFLAGYKTARRELGIEPTTQENEFYGEFQTWLQKRFQVQSVNCWAKIIMLYSVDEKEGFEYFFQLLDEFWRRGESLQVDEVEVKEERAIANKGDRSLAL
ncbi:MULTISPECIES: hypothetical protein [unclassified Microcoleus]|uniref:hypothetical protein n=1 Tax=unclassified Microcoleus TaxID=2642155 RepID=UPI0025D5823F|nr:MULTISPECIES: hypothetical protein [unclassified Microcoleus]